MDLLYRLGLSSHPSTVRAQLQSSADHFDKEIMAWRSQIERNRKQIKLLDEVIATQAGSQFGESDAMELCSVDFSLETMQKCKNFDGEICQT